MNNQQNIGFDIEYLKPNKIQVYAKGVIYHIEEKKGLWTVRHKEDVFHDDFLTLSNALHWLKMALGEEI